MYVCVFVCVCVCVEVFGNVKGRRVAVWTDSGHCCVCVCAGVLHR